jgi:NitT/TauT family transport system permease protein
MRLWLRGNAPAALVFVALIALWETVCRLAKVPVWLLPSPGQIATALWSSKDILPLHIFTTTWEVLAGFAVAVGVGIPLSILIVFSAFARKLIYPFLVVLQSVPKVALAPIMLLWIGYGTSSKVLIAAVTAFFPIIINTSAGMEAVPVELLELSRSLNSPPLMVFWRVRLPYAMPYVFSGMKVAMALALIGAVVGEFVGADRGLGYLILTFSSTMNTALVFGAIVLLASLGIVLFYLVTLAERIACPWYVVTNKNQYI